MDKVIKKYGSLWGGGGESYHFPKAVALVVFNRLDCVQEQFKVLRQVTPPKLYVISDGARTDINGEAEKVSAVRKYIEDNIDWECEVIKIYAEENMGCDRRSISGYNYVFEKEESAVLLEDDSIPSVDFYRYTEKMLDYYKDTPEVMMVGGYNLAPDFREDGKDYYFSYFPAEYAWATWRRAWKLIGTWRENYDNWNDKCLYEMMPKRVANVMRGRILANYNGWSAWDSIWNFVMLYHRGYGVVSAQNYVQNIGTGREDAFHPGEYNAFMRPAYGKIPENFKYRSKVHWDKEYDFYQSEMRFKEGCDKNWYQFYIRENCLWFAKKYFPKWLYKGIGRIKRGLKIGESR